MGLQEQSWFFDILRSIFAFLDGLVYGAIKWILFGIFDLANLNTNSEIFGNIYSRIYVILGIFMAFKLSFSFIQYIIDPDSMTGKSDKSLGKLLSRVFIMLCALIFLPTFLFGANGNEGILSRAQRAFLPSLPRLIFGVDDIGGLSGSYSTSNSGTKFSDTIEQSANDITVATLKGFFYTPDDIDTVCPSGTYDSSPPIESIDEFQAYVNLTCTKRGDIDIGIGALHTGTRYYKYSYMPFISTVFGVLLAILLLGITLDIAKRLFKLMVLEVIAPVPIMSLIDPKSNKDGAFSHWAKSLSSTFLDIFFKLGLVYIVIVFIQLIVNSGDSGGLFANFPSDSGFRSVYLTLLLILGLVFFAKEAPKFIKNALNIKGEGNGLFDDVKSIGKAAGLVSGAAVGTAGVIGSTVGNIRAQHEGNQEYFQGQHVRNSLRNIGAGLSGLVGGTAAGVKGLTGKDGGLKSVMQKQQERNAKSFDFRRHGGTLSGSLGSSMRRAFTGESSYDSMELKWKKEEDAIKAEETSLKPMQDANAHRKSIMDRVKSKTVESLKTSGTGSTYGISGNYREYNSMYEAAKSGIGITTLSSGKQGFIFNGQEIDMALADSIGQDLLDANSVDYYAKAYANHDFDSSIGSQIEMYKAETGTDIESSLGEIKKAFGSNSSEITRRSNAINKRKESLSDAQRGAKATKAKTNSNRYSSKK